MLKLDNLLSQILKRNLITILSKISSLFKKDN